MQQELFPPSPVVRRARRPGKPTEQRQYARDVAEERRADRPQSYRDPVVQNYVRHIRWLKRQPHHPEPER